MNKYFFAACGLAFLLAACASSHVESGTPIDAAKVAGIEKGKTTAADVEAMFGRPNSTTMMGSGTRIATYVSLRSDAAAQVDGKAFIPIVGPLVAETKGHGTFRQQILQVTYGTDNVVQNVMFSDNTTNTTTTAGALTGVQTQSTTTPTTTPQ